jgi:hypothetical protein
MLTAEPVTWFIAARSANIARGKILLAIVIAASYLPASIKVT